MTPYEILAERAKSVRDEDVRALAERARREKDTRIISLCDAALRGSLTARLEIRTHIAKMKRR